MQIAEDPKQYKPARKNKCKALRRADKHHKGTRKAKKIGLPKACAQQLHWFFSGSLEAWAADRNTGALEMLQSVSRVAFCFCIVGFVVVLEWL